MQKKILNGTEKNLKMLKKFTRNINLYSLLVQKKFQKKVESTRIFFVRTLVFLDLLPHRDLSLE